MRLTDLMHKDPPSIAATASVGEARAALDRVDHGHLLVLDADGRLAGVVSDRDLAARADDAAIVDVMTSDVVTATRDETLVAAMVEIVTRGIGCLPVLENGEVLGLLTDLGLVRSFAAAAAEGRFTPEDDPRVDVVHSKATVVAFPATTLAEAEELCHARRIRHLPVVEDEHLVGVVSDRDLRRARREGAGDATPVSEVMTQQPLSIDPEASLSLAAAEMAHHGVRSLPVVREGRLEGIVTATDVVDRVMNTMWG